MLSLRHKYWVEDCPRGQIHSVKCPRGGVMNVSLSIFSGIARLNSKHGMRALAACALILLVCVPHALFSQSSQGTISGVVQDQTGGSVAEAAITVTDVARGIARNLRTDDTGTFVAPSLNPGSYTVRAEAKGFGAVERTNVLVEVGQTIRLDITLQPGEQTQTVTVTEELPIVNTTDAVLG